MKKIFSLLRAQIGHDFSGYKQNTINRRVDRRMAVHQIDRVEGYVRYLQQNPIEVEALFNDLLIGVTSFFRDPEAFAALQTEAIPKLFDGKSPGDSVRVWVPGCSTGEEAYSIAILLQEHMEALKQNFKLQVFATDIDKRAVEQARSGFYPASIAADVSPERLARFFVLDDSGGYRIHKSIRDILVFSEQDIIKDPPFSKLDLISCRNLMIYLDGDLQKKIIPLFHYALNPGGILFLGTSESVGEHEELFAALDRQSKLYQSRTDAFGAQRPRLATYLPPMGNRGAVPRSSVLVPNERKNFLREVTERTLLAQYAAAGVLVNESGEIQYLHGRTGRYLEPAPGEAVMNILKMAREGLQRELAAALHKASAQKEPVRQENLQVKTNGGFSAVHLTVQPVAAGADKAVGQKLLLVTLEEVPAAAAKHPRKVSAAKQKAAGGEGDKDEQLALLKQELSEREETIQRARGELETSNEELRSANEEMQSVNEEMQSTNEEMETSKEELQSVNEELSTVNSELQTKVVNLSQVNNDMNNLLAGTGVGTIFVDYKQCIRRFTPSIIQVINLIPTDVGRPVGHIAVNLTGYDSLVSDVQSVLDTLVPKEVEVQNKEGAWFMLRIRPYRTLENVIEGAVISFFDITEIKRVQAELWETAEKRRVLFDTMPQGVLFQDKKQRIVEANPAAERILGVSVDQMKGREFGYPHWKTVREDGSDFPADVQPAMLAIRTGQAAQGIVMGVNYPHKAGITWIRVNSIPLFKHGETTPYQVYTTFDDITASKLSGQTDKRPGTSPNLPGGAG